MFASDRADGNVDVWRVAVDARGAAGAPERLTTSAAADDEPSPAANRPVRTQAPDNCRVLIVDDNVDSATMLNLLLPSWGYRTAVAHSGTEAIERARTFSPHIILLDIGLPEMSGYEVAERLRQDPSHASTVLVALTGYGQEEDRRRTHEAGFAAHLTKPVDVETLNRMLIAVCEKGGL